MRFLVILSLLPCTAVAQRNTDSLRMFIATQLKNYNIPALSIGVVKGDSTLLEQGFGTLSTIDSTVVTSTTIFPIMSCTKAFTATAFAILADNGRLKWTDKVTRYLSGFRLKDLSITRNLDIADILSHRSGLASFEGDLLWYNTHYSPTEIIYRIRHSPITRKFRKEYGYQNVMYIVAGSIIEKVSNQKWSSFIQDSIFTRLGMHNSYADQNAIGKEIIALPHLTDVPVQPLDLSNVAPAGGIYSTAKDMIRWMQVWMKRGEALISEKSFEEIVSPKIYIGKNKNTAYGLGWEINGKTISHGGGLPGYKSLVTIDLENKIGIVILTNKITYFNEELTNILTDWLKGKAVNWAQLDRGLVTKGVKFSWEDQPVSKQPHGLSSSKIKNYTGLYQEAGYGDVLIESNADTATINFLPTDGRIKGYLKHLHGDNFEVMFSDAFMPSGKVVFERTREGKVYAFHFDIPPGDFIFNHFLFRKKHN